MTWIETPFAKNPGDDDIIPFRYDWLINNPIYAGYVLDSYTFRVFDSSDTVHPEMIHGTPWNDAKFLYLPISGGEDPNDYYVMGSVTFKKAGSPDFVREWELLIQVRQEGI